MKGSWFMCCREHWNISSVLLVIIFTMLTYNRNICIPLYWQVFTLMREPFLRKLHDEISLKMIPLLCSIKKNLFYLVNIVILFLHFVIPLLFSFLSIPHILYYKVYCISDLPYFGLYNKLTCWLYIPKILTTLCFTCRKTAQPFQPVMLLHPCKLTWQQSMPRIKVENPETWYFSVAFKRHQIRASSRPEVNPPLKLGEKKGFDDFSFLQPTSCDLCSYTHFFPPDISTTSSFTCRPTEPASSGTAGISLPCGRTSQGLLEQLRVSPRDENYCGF